MGEQDDFVARGNSEEEVINQMMNHARMNHPDKMEDMPEEEMRNMMRSKIKEE